MLQNNKIDLNVISGVQDISDVTAEKCSGGLTQTREQIERRTPAVSAWLAARYAFYEENYGTQTVRTQVDLSNIH